MLEKVRPVDHLAERKHYILRPIAADAPLTEFVVMLSGCALG